MSGTQPHDTKGGIDMKVTMNKQVISLEEAHEANELRKEYQSYDKDIIETLIRTAASANSAVLNPKRPYLTCERVISIDKMEVTKNRYKLTVWVECIIKVDIDIIAEIQFDGQQAMTHVIDSGDPVDAYIQVYRQK